ncbi:MAG: hypothetical protein ACP5P4_03400 [Steroidobacteraceae bacterium]
MDDLREGSSRVLLGSSGWRATGRAYDPVAVPEARRLFGERYGLELRASAFQALGWRDLAIG